jgi:hypothetical protein
MFDVEYVHSCYDLTLMKSDIQDKVDLTLDEQEAMSSDDDIDEFREWCRC